MRGLKLEQIHLESGSFPFDNGLVQFSKRETDDSDKKDVIYKVIDLGASDSIKKIDLDRSIISVNTNGETIDFVFKKMKIELHHYPERIALSFYVKDSKKLKIHYYITYEITNASNTLPLDVILNMILNIDSSDWKINIMAYEFLYAIADNLEDSVYKEELLRYCYSLIETITRIINLELGALDVRLSHYEDRIPLSSQFAHIGEELIEIDMKEKIFHFRGVVEKYKIPFKDIRFSIYDRGYEGIHMFRGFFLITLNSGRDIDICFPRLNFNIYLSKHLMNSILYSYIAIEDEKEKIKAKTFIIDFIDKSIPLYQDGFEPGEGLVTKEDLEEIRKNI